MGGDRPEGGWLLGSRICCLLLWMWIGIGVGLLIAVVSSCNVDARERKMQERVCV